MEFRQHISFVDQVGQSIRVDAHLAAMLLDPSGDLLQQLEPQGRFAIATEYDLIIGAGVTYTLNDLFRLRALIQGQIVFMELVPALGLGTKPANQGAAVCNVEIQTVADSIGDLRHCV